MTTKPIDKSKKSNTRCWNCQHWTDVPDYKRVLDEKRKWYYNRCKLFAWKEGKTYADDHK